MCSLGRSYEDVNRFSLTGRISVSIEGLTKIYPLRSISLILCKYINNCFGAGGLMEVLKGEQSIWNARGILVEPNASHCLLPVLFH